MRFKKPYLYNALEGLNFQSFTEIQQKVIPDALKGRDIIGVSETGSGKTHAYLLPLFDRLDEEKKRIQAVILSPTRELAEQILAFARAIAAYNPKKPDIRIYTGGRDRAREIERLQKSQPQIVIGTPGKIFDLALKENVLKIHTADTLVVDEADMSLEVGFLKEMEAIAAAVGEKSQFMVFSATFPDNLRGFIKKSMHQPLEVVLGRRRLSRLPIRHRFVKTAPAERMEMLEKVIDAINPYLAMIFANTTKEVDEIAMRLREKDLDVTRLHGDMSARERKQAVRDIQNLHVQYIVASDMASRGIDITGVSHIVNHAFPADMTFYIHRVGRTARMGMDGEAITLYDPTRDERAFSFLKKEGVEPIHTVIEDGRLVSKEKRPKKDGPEAGRAAKSRPAYKKRYRKDVRRKKSD